MTPGRDSIEVEFPGGPSGPVRNILVRIGIALGLILFVALLTYAGRDGYVDPEDDDVRPARRLLLLDGQHHDDGVR